MQLSITDIPNLDELKITGDIRVERVTAKVPHNSWRYLIMGPTGAGKSNFIETLAAKSQCLSISKDQLAGYTQQVTAYRLVGITCSRDPIYLVDTPGFNDTKISEIEIMDMIRFWLLENQLTYVHRILYIMPITETRLAGSKWKTIEMLKVFLHHDNLRSIMFVTTMWDTIHNDRTRQRAESNLAQLYEVFKECIDAGAKIAQFTNTRDSALQILDRGRWISSSFSREGRDAAPNLYQALIERIQGSLQRKRMVEADLAQPEAQTNLELKTLLEKNHSEDQETLTNFISLLANFGDPPLGFRRAAQGLRKTIADEVLPMDSHYEEMFQLWAQEPVITEDADTPPVRPDPIAQVANRPSTLSRLLNIAKRWPNW